MSLVETTSVGDYSESETLSVSDTRGSPRVKIIPIQVKSRHAPMPVMNMATDSTTSTIEDLLAEKVERIAGHLELANTNILDVGGKINHYRDESKQNTHDNLHILTDLRNQIDSRLAQQNAVNSKLSRHLKGLARHSKKPDPLQNITTGSVNGAQPVFVPHYTYPPAASRHTNVGGPESTDAFLERIRRDANERVNEAIRRTTEQKDKDDTIDKLRTFLEQQNQERERAERQQVAERAQQVAERAQHVSSELDQANAEIRALHAQLSSLRTGINSTQKLKKQNQKTEIEILRSTLEQLTGERAEMDNKILQLTGEMNDLRVCHERDTQKLKDEYTDEIEGYRRRYDQKLDELQAKSNSAEHRNEHQFKQEIKAMRVENERMGGQLGMLGHELETRDREIVELRSQLMILRNEKLGETDESRLFDKTLLASVSSILQDLGAPPSIMKNEYMSNKEISKMIVDELLKAVEKVKLAEAQTDRLEKERQEMKVKMAKLLDKISREKELKAQTAAMQNEASFQDTISVLQKELNRTRKQIRLHQTKSKV